MKAIAGCIASLAAPGGGDAERARLAELLQAQCGMLKAEGLLAPLSALLGGHGGSAGEEAAENAATNSAIEDGGDAAEVRRLHAPFMDHASIPMGMGIAVYSIESFILKCVSLAIKFEKVYRTTKYGLRAKNHELFLHLCVVKFVMYSCCMLTYLSVLIVFPSLRGSNRYLSAERLCLCGTFVAFYAS